MASLCVRELAGWRGYCPAGDVGDHDWLPASADLSTLMRLGWIPRAGERLTEDEPQGDPILIR